MITCFKGHLGEKYLTRFIIHGLNELERDLWYTYAIYMLTYS